MITRKQWPLQPPYTPLSSCKIKSWSCIWWCHSKFPTAFSLLQGPNPGKSFIFFSTSNTHTLLPALNPGSTTSGVNERSRSVDETAVSTGRLNQSLSNPRSLIKRQWCTADGSDAFSHTAAFLMSVCDLFGVIGSPQWRAEVLGRSWSGGGAAGVWLDRCMSSPPRSWKTRVKACGEQTS